MLTEDESRELVNATVKRTFDYKKVHQLPATDSWVPFLFKNGDYVYVADNDKKCLMISNQSTPDEWLGKKSFPQAPYSMLIVKPNFVIVGFDLGQVQMLDLSSPEMPRVIWRVDLPTNETAIKCIYWLDRDQGLVLLSCC